MLGWLKSETVTPPTPAGCWQELSNLAGRITKDMAALEMFVLFAKLISLTIKFSDSILWYLLKGLEILFSPHSKIVFLYL